MATLIVHLTRPLPRAEAEALVTPDTHPLLRELLLGWSAYVGQGGNSSRTKRLFGYVKKQADEHGLPVDVAIVGDVAAYLAEHGLIPAPCRDGQRRWCLTWIADFGGHEVTEPAPAHEVLPYDLVVRDERGTVFARGKSADRDGGKACLQVVQKQHLGGTHVDLVHNGRVVETFAL